MARKSYYAVSPFKFGSDLFELGAWEWMIRRNLEISNGDDWDPMIFRPSREEREALMRYAASHDQVIRQVLDCLKFTEDRFDDFREDASELHADDLSRAQHALADRIAMAISVLKGTAKTTEHTPSDMERAILKCVKPGATFSPKEIKEELDGMYNENSIDQQLPKMIKRGFIEKLQGRGNYRRIHGLSDVSDIRN